MQHGIEIIEQEFIQIKPVHTEEKHVEVLQWTEVPEPVAVVFTSQHAVEKVVMQNRFYSFQDRVKWKIFSIGGNTKALVKKYFPATEIVDTAMNAADLARKIIQHGTFKKVVFFCGNQRRDDLPRLLKEAGIEVTEVIVYETIETPIRIKGELDGILFFSPSAVKSYCSVNAIPDTTTCFAIGETTALAVVQHSGRVPIVASIPDQHKLIDTVITYLNFKVKK